MTTTATLDHHAIRAAALADCITIAETDHQRAVAADPDTAPSREAVIVAVLDEANAYWTIENDLAHRPRTLTVDEARETADDLRRVIAERVSGIIASLRSPRRASSSVFADTYQVAEFPAAYAGNLAQVVAPSGGKVRVEDDTVLLDQAAVDLLRDVADDVDGLIEADEAGNLVMYADGASYMVIPAGARGIDW